MAAEIFGVQPGSLAERAGMEKGDRLISINGHDITDVLDFRFFETNTHLTVVFEKADGRRLEEKIIKSQYGSLGLEFETYLMDKQRSCRNKCVFCFIDQLPKGMRKTLYFKDDDARLSFLFGNYITLTNIGEDEIDRIIKMHISPVNISVHTTNPELRCKMMNNRFAGEKLQYIEKLAQEGIKINCQLVLCRGINDGDELRRSIEDLLKFYPAVESIAAVPAGLTRYRDGLFPLESYDKSSASEVIDIIEEYSNRHFEEYGDRLIYPSDEFFNLSEREMPNEEYYGDMLQLENGVGMSALLKAEFARAVEDREKTENEINSNRKTIATGIGSYNLIKSLVDLCKTKWHNVNCEVVAVENEFFGEKITTTGLLTGQDIYNKLKGIDNLGQVLISKNCLKSDEDIFLDDLSVDELSQKLQTTVTPIANSGEDLLNAILGCE